MPNLLDYVNDYLIAQNLVRDPRVAGSKPPLWLEPRDGVPAPGESPKNNSTEMGPDIVVGAFNAQGIATGRHNGFMRIDAVDFWIRVRRAPLVDDFEKSLRTALHDKRGWSMTGLYVAESLVFRELQRIGADQSGWTFTTQYTFQTFTQ
jgi:hypothetical protein